MGILTPIMYNINRHVLTSTALKKQTTQGSSINARATEDNKFRVTEDGKRRVME